MGAGGAILVDWKCWERMVRVMSLMQSCFKATVKSYGADVLKMVLVSWYVA